MLKISKADYDLIRWEAKRSYPHECCGILLGNVVDGHRLVTLTLTCENMRVDSPADRYSINPEQVIAALKLARSRGRALSGSITRTRTIHPITRPLIWRKPIGLIVLM